MNLPTSPCKGCGKAIVWGTSEEGKRIPLDPSPPVYDVVSTERAGGILVNRNRTALVSHFATCPQANRFSGGSAVPDLNTRGARTAASASAEAAERREDRVGDDAAASQGG